MSLNKAESDYLDMLQHIMHHGVDKTDRTGTGTREVFGYNLRIVLSDDFFPIFTTKQVYWKKAFGEMLWMLSGSRNIRPLIEQGNHIWTDWPLKRYNATLDLPVTRDEFEKRILKDDAFSEEWGDTGGSYGYHWRNWPTYKPSCFNVDFFGNKPNLFEHGPGIDQVQLAIDKLINKPDDRRIIIEGWNVAEIENMAAKSLPPCHKTYQFLTAGDKLNLHVTLRKH